MLSWSQTKTKTVAALGAGTAVGWTFVKVWPLANSNPYLLLALPVMLMIMLMLVVNIHSFLVLLLLSRALLDPLLESTKISVAGDDLGLGALINLSVIAFAGILCLKAPSRILQNKVSRAWLIFLTVCAVSTLYAPFAGPALKLLFNQMSYMAIMVIPFYIVRKRQDKKFWIKILFLATLLPLAIGNWELLFGAQYFNHVGLRVQSTFSHPNIFAFFLIFQIALVFYMLKTDLFEMNGLQRNALRLIFVNAVGLLAATQTRNAWIACWLFFFVYGLLKERKYLILSLVLPPLGLFHPDVRARVTDLFYSTGITVESEMNSMAWRKELWKRALPSIREHWMFGHGLASFKPLSLNFFPSPNGEGAPAHNTYVETVFETGAVGLLAYLALYFSLLKLFYGRARRLTKGLSVEYAILTAYVASYVFSCAGDNMHDYLSFNWYFWFLAGLLIPSPFYQPAQIHEIHLRHRTLV